MVTLAANETHTLPAPRRYWQLSQVAEKGIAAPFSGSCVEAAAQLEILLRDAVRLRMEADVPLGAFLSGGVDSSTVVALMQAQSTRPIKTFTIGFHESQYNEAEKARAVARHLRTEHTDLYVTAQMARDVIPLLPQLYDEPFADSSQIPTFLVSQLARQHVKVSLSGDAADELFGGYGRYFLALTIWSKLAWLPALGRQLSAGVIRTIPAAAWNAIGKVIRPTLPGTRRERLLAGRASAAAELLQVSNREELYYRLISDWKRPAEVVIGGSEPPTALKIQDSWP